MKASRFEIRPELPNLTRCCNYTACLCFEKNNRVRW